MAGTCLMCNKKLKAGQRADTLYCSQKCRSKAYRFRAATTKRMQVNQLDMFQKQDLKVVADVSATAGEFIAKCANLVGKEFANEALDAFWDLAYHCGCNFAERLGKNEKS